MASEIQLTEWHTDFGQAKAALRNLDLLVKALVQSQIDAANRLKWLYTNYDEFVADDSSEQTKAAIHEQLRLFERIEHNLNITSNKFAAKAAAQLDAARTQVAFVHQTLTKLKSLKPPQYDEAALKLSHQVPEFLNLFDAFLARFTLQTRIQQAEYYKQLGGAFTHAGQPQPIRSILEQWRSEYQQIMPAVEALKSVNPQPLPPRPHGHATSVLGDQQHMSTIEKSESVLLAPVKWVHSKLTHELKEVKFTDPSAGLFHFSGAHGLATDEENGASHARNDSVRAIFDFKSDTDSDLQFKKGDIIKIVDRGTEDDPNWWCGELNGQRGLFPKNHVEELYQHRHDSRPRDGGADEYVPKVDESPQHHQPQHHQPQHPQHEGPGDEEFGAFTKHPGGEEQHPPPKPPRPTKQHIQEETATEAAPVNNEALPLAGTELNEGPSSNQLSSAPVTQETADAQLDKPGIPTKNREAAAPNAEGASNTLTSVKIPTSSSDVHGSESPVDKQQQQHAHEQNPLNEPLLDAPTLNDPKTESTPSQEPTETSSQLENLSLNSSSKDNKQQQPQQQHDSADELL